MVGHHTGSYNIKRGSVQHRLLRLLDACELSAIDSLSIAGDPEKHTPRRWMLNVLQPLREMSLIDFDRGAQTWATTELGSELAGRLGPLDDDAPPAKPAREPSQSGADGLQRSCGPRRYVGLLCAAAPAMRPGSDDAARLPSRMGDVLYWPDGRQEAMP